MMKIVDLVKMQAVLNISAIAKKSGINTNTLRGKIIRETELTVTESEKIQETLLNHYLQFCKDISTKESLH